LDPKEIGPDQDKSDVPILQLSASGHNGGRGVRGSFPHSAMESSRKGGVVAFREGLDWLSVREMKQNDPNR
jgi:hypothetical protein